MWIEGTTLLSCRMFSGIVWLVPWVRLVLLSSILLVSNVLFSQWLGCSRQTNKKEKEKEKSIYEDREDENEFWDYKFHLMETSRLFPQVTGGITFFSLIPTTFIKTDRFTFPKSNLWLTSKSWIEQITFSDHYVTQEVNNNNNKKEIKKNLLSNLWIKKKT